MHTEQSIGTQLVIGFMPAAIMFYGLLNNDLILIPIGFVLAIVMLVMSLREKDDYTLETADDAYYNEGDPVMTDAEYDTMKRQNPTEKVGAPVVGGEKHMTRMLSLSNAIDKDELRDFFNRTQSIVGACEFMIEPKIDGLALNLTYSGGSLQSAVTRGDGVKGKVVTDKVRHIVPETIGMDTVEIRGEIYLEKPALAALNEGRAACGLARYKTCQSAATATLMHESAAICEARGIKFVAYDMGDSKYAMDKSQVGIVESLKRMKFKTLEHSKVRTFDGMLRAAKRIHSETKLPSDGSVIKVMSLKQQSAIGNTKQCPKWAIAWKGQ